MDYEWLAQPTDKACTIFVHFRDSKDIVFQDDHGLSWPLSTTNWTGTVAYSRRVFVPADTPEGTYEIRVGLYDAATKGRNPINAGSDLRKLEDQSIVANSIQVNRSAPAETPDQGVPSALDFSRMKETFRDDFDEIDVSSCGPFTRWTAHTPNGKDFGEATFTNPRPGFPFSVKDGILSIIARKFNPRWRSGILSSVGPGGDGFSQQFGYFELRAKLPDGEGTWPAFWLLPVETLDNPDKSGVEIDIFEQYGRDPKGLHFSMHLRRPGEPTKTASTCVGVRDTNRDFHTYGFYWDRKVMIWFFDSREMWRYPTPVEACTPMYILIDLALGGGWPIKIIPSSITMDVDYIKVLK
jgi:beta-glucanase (GH16 family)